MLCRFTHTLKHSTHLPEMIMTATTQKNNRFVRTFTRTGKTVYTCVECGKQTRETGNGESGLELCAFCYDLAGWENSLSDGHIDEAGFNEIIKDLCVKHNKNFANYEIKVETVSMNMDELLLPEFAAA